MKTKNETIARVTRVYQWYGAPRLCLEPPDTPAGARAVEIVSDWDHLARLDVRLGDHVVVRQTDGAQPEVAGVIIERRNGNERRIPTDKAGRMWMGRMDLRVN